MKRIRIISNPYKKEILFQLEKNQVWEDIDIINNPNSKLIGEEFQTQFFPFKIEEIINIIQNEYGIGEDRIEIVFQGTPDHFNELEHVAKALENSNINVVNDNTYLLNADDVLPEIIRIFNDLRSIINEVEGQQELLKNNINRFSDSSADRIPLCVIGNYSSGKSTFINALIGKEILPSGSDPVTARVFKITQLLNDDSSYMYFEHENQNIRLQLYDDSYELIFDSETPFITGLMNLLKEFEKYNDNSLCINECIRYINEASENEVSPIINIGTSFKGEIWETCDSKFIILDTPGSNSATNINHSDVLDQALKNLTNGLPLYVCESNTLDSTDNMNLYNKIKGMPEIDSRFTMIIVNKADDANLPREGFYSEDKKNKLLNLAIPKSMYSIGLYFVSSILGLASKVDDELNDNHYNKTAYLQISCYENPKSKYYTQLYNYNIMPKQIKDGIVEICQNNEDLVYTNSGLYAVESGIKTFAQKYAPYNKCQQSVLYLEKIIEIIDYEINQAKIKSNQKRIDLENDLDENKKKLIQDIDCVSHNRKEEFLSEGKNELKQYVQEETANISVVELKAYETSFTEELKEHMDYSGYKERSKSSVERLKTNLNNSVSNIMNERSVNSLSDAWSSVKNGVSNVVENVRDQYDAKNNVDKKASEILIEKVKEEFINKNTLFVEKVYAMSSTYWLEKTDLVRKELNKIVMGSSALSNDKKVELSAIIDNYEKINLIKQEFDYTINEFKYLQILNNEKLNKSKISKYCNKLFRNNAIEIRESTYMHHSETFTKWLAELISILKVNIVEYNPVLSKLQEEINHELYKISNYQRMLVRINNNISYIRGLMNWQKNEVE